MDVWIFPVCFGVLNFISCIYCKIFLAQSKVEWFHADEECKQSNGILFRPDETSFDVRLFPQETFEDSWVAASYIFINYPEDYFRYYPLTSRYRCIAIEIQQNCSIRYWHRACHETYSRICESNNELQTIHQGQMDWRRSSDSCERTSVKLATIINTELLFNLHPCQCGFYWTGRVIKVIFQSIRPNHHLGYCGTLHNNVLSFENCYRKLRPLCFKAEQTITRSPYYSTSTRSPYYTSTSTRSPYYSTSTIVIGALEKNSTMTSSTTKCMPTISVPTSTTIVQFSTIEMTSQRSNSTSWYPVTVKEENKSPSSQPGTDMERAIGATASFKGESNSPDTGLIIGSVIGGIVFLLLMALLVILLRKRLQHGNGMSSSAKHEKTTSTSLNHTLDAAYSVDNQDYMLQHGNNDSYTNHHKMCNRGIMEDISEPSNYIYSMTDSELNVATYATVKPKDVRKASNGSKSITYEVNEQLNDPKEIGSENVTGNVYDKANFHLRDGPNDQSETIYDTTNESSKSMYQSNEMYNKVKCGRTGEYMTHVTRMDTDFTYDHV